MAGRRKERMGKILGTSQFIAHDQSFYSVFTLTPSAGFLMTRIRNVPIQIKHRINAGQESSVTSHFDSEGLIIKLFSRHPDASEVWISIYGLFFPINNNKHAYIFLPSWCSLEDGTQTWHTKIQDESLQAHHTLTLGQKWWLAGVIILWVYTWFIGKSFPLKSGLFKR